MCPTFVCHSAPSSTSSDRRLVGWRPLYFRSPDVFLNQWPLAPDSRSVLVLVLFAQFLVGAWRRCPFGRACNHGFRYLAGGEEMFLVVDTARRRQVLRLRASLVGVCLPHASGIAPLRVWRTVNVHPACRFVNTRCGGTPSLMSRRGLSWAAAFPIAMMTAPEGRAACLSIGMTPKRLDTWRDYRSMRRHENSSSAD